MDNSRRKLKDSDVNILMPVIVRALSFIRDIALAALLGISPAANALIIAWRIPQTLRRPLDEITLSSSLTQVMAGHTERFPKEADRVFFTFFSIIGLVALVIGLFVFFAALPLVIGFAPGLMIAEAMTTVDMAVGLLKILVIYFVVSILAAILTAKVRAEQKSLSAPSLIFQLVIVIGIVFVAPRFSSPATVVACFISLGALGQFLFLAPALLRTRLRPVESFHQFITPLMSFLRLYLPSVLNVLAFQGNVFIITVVASLASVGGVATFYFAISPFELLLGLSSTTIISKYHARLKYAAQRYDNEILHDVFISATNKLLVYASPVILFFYLKSESRACLIYQHGAMDMDAAVSISRVMSYYALGFFFMISLPLLSPVFFALRDLRPLRAASGLNFLILTLMGFMLIDTMGLPGLALAATLGAGANYMYLIFILRRRLGSIAWGELSIVVLKAAIALMGAYLGIYFTEQMQLGSTTQALVSMAAFMLPYLGILFILSRILDKNKATD